MSETPLTDAVADCRVAVNILVEMRQEVYEAQQKVDALQRDYEAQFNVVSQAWNKLLDLAIGYEGGE